jgi:general secretion pathway protein I
MVILMISLRACPHLIVISCFYKVSGTSRRRVSHCKNKRLLLNEDRSTAYKKKIAGLTLIEVLIALAIISIAMTAIVKATAENIRATRYLVDKTEATWVGLQVINDVRAGMLRLSAEDPLGQTTEMLGRTWFWQAALVATPNPHIRKVAVTVYRDEEHDESSLVSLESYIYRKSDM